MSVERFFSTSESQHVGTPPQGDLAAVGLEEGGIADQAGAGDVGVGDRHGSVREKRAF